MTLQLATVRFLCVLYGPSFLSNRPLVNYVMEYNMVCCLFFSFFLEYHSDSEEIDVKSCILSLIDLYSHWLMQPLHVVLLNHVLRSILMLSDLFASVS